MTKISIMNSIDRGPKIRYSGMKDHPTWSIIISLARSPQREPPLAVTRPTVGPLRLVSQEDVPGPCCILEGVERSHLALSVD